jgi:GxxExxY protein
MARAIKISRPLTEKIIGASFEVHKFIGNGFQEIIYQRALAWNFTSRTFICQGN